MSGHLGTTARMVPAVPASAQSESRPPRYSVQETPSKRWAFDHARDGVMPRSWQVDLALLSPQEMAVLDEFVQGAWGRGPFRWISCAAHDSNVLTPRQSVLASLDAGTGMDTAAGWSPRSVLGPASTVLAAGVPVLPGKPMTAAVDVSGAATLTLTLRNATGGVVGTQTKAATGTLAQRLVLTVPSVPATARTVELTVSGHIRAARPQVSWTATARPWAPGRGADSVVIQEGTSDPLHINRSGGYWTGSLSLLEVG